LVTRVIYSELAIMTTDLGLDTHLFVKGNSTRRQPRVLFGLRVKLPLVTTSLTTQR